MNTTPKPRVSIIIVSWNVEDLLRKCLTSLGSGERNDWEIIVVDSNSPDDSADMVRKEFPKVLLFAEETNVGISVGNNIGINAAQGDYLLILNPDTEIVDDAVDKLADYLDSHTEVGAVAPKLLLTDGTVQLSIADETISFASIFYDISGLSYLFPQSRIFNGQRLIDWGYAEERDIARVATACLLIRRDVVDVVGGWDEQFFLYGDDVDFCYRVSKSGFIIRYVPSIEIFHHKGKSAEQVKFVVGVWYLEGQWRFFKKHRGSLYAGMFRAMVAVVALSWLVATSLMRLVEFSQDKKERLGLVAERYRTMRSWAFRRVDPSEG